MEYPEPAIVESSGSKLTIFPPSALKSGWYDYDTLFEAPGLSVRQNVPDLGGSSVANFFAALEAESTGWTGEKKWSSIEGNLNLSATIDRTGHIKCTVIVRTNRGRDDWSTTSCITIESGAQLSRFVADLKRLFD